MRRRTAAFGSVWPPAACQKISASHRNSIAGYLISAYDPTERGGAIEMRIHYLLLVSIFLLTEHVAHAQNSDFGLLIGVSWPVSEVVSGSTNTVRGSVGGGGQFNYAFQVLQRSADLYVELPLVISVRDTGVITATSPTGSTSVAASTSLQVFFTPGVRVKFSPESRVSLYGALGGGLLTYGANQFTTSGQNVRISNATSTTAALDFGGGVDFRLTRLLSLRFDLRDFVTRSGVAGVVGRNHAIFGFGVAFHF
jgi:hypothetical protein